MDKIYGTQRINTAQTAQYPRGRTPPSIEQLLQGDGSSNSPGLARDHDHEEYYSHHNKKSSVLMKVKEAAKKLRYNLSKKKQGQESAPPPWGVSLDEDEEDVDPEYLGAPMYESEQAPEASREIARQHPRETTVIPEKHLWPNSVNNEAEQEKKQSNPPSPNKTITKTLSGKFGPAYAAVTDTPQAIASKIEGLNVAPPTTAVDAPQEKPDGVSRQENENSETEYEEQHETQTVPPKVAGMMTGATPAVADSAVSSGDGTGELVTSGQQNWDKGVSVKEYLMQKLEPGEDERALCQVITEAISPRRTGGDMGVVNKVIDAVTSLLRTRSDQSSQPATVTTNSSSSAPVSPHSQQVTEEERHGRILQAN